MKFAGSLQQGSNHFLVGAVYAVEIADAYNSRPEIRRKLADGTEELHAQSSNSRRSPSWAKRTFAGSDALVSSWGRSCEMWVKKARLGFSSSTSFNEFSTLECVGRGRCRRASRKRMSSPRSFCFESSGTSLNSVR